MTDRPDLVKPRRGLLAGVIVGLLALLWALVRFAVRHWPWTLTVLASAWLVHAVGAPSVKVIGYIAAAIGVAGVVAICVREQRGYLRIGREEFPAAEPESTVAVAVRDAETAPVPPLHVITALSARRGIDAKTNPALPTAPPRRRERPVA